MVQVGNKYINSDNEPEGCKPHGDNWSNNDNTGSSGGCGSNTPPCTSFESSVPTC